MLINEVGGVDISTDTFATAPLVKELFRAGGAIPIGTAVKADTAAAYIGKNVIAATSADGNKGASSFVGIYTGVGGSGAVGTVTNLPGNAAVAGDMVLIAIEGTVYALAGTGGVTAGSALKIADTSGRMTDYDVSAISATKTIGLAFEAASAGAAFRMYVE